MVEKDQEPFVCINSSDIFSFSKVEFKIQHEMSVVSATVVKLSAESVRHCYFVFPLLRSFYF